MGRARVNENSMSISKIKKPRHVEAWGGLLLSLILWAPHLARAQTPSPSTGGACSNVELFDRLGPPRDQDGTAWCFANSAADLITAATGTRVETFDVAFNLFFGDSQRVRNHPDSRLQSHIRKSQFFARRLPEARRSPREFARALNSDTGVVNIGGEDDDVITMANARGLCRESNFRAGREHLQPNRQVQENLREIWRLHQSQRTGRPGEFCPVTSGTSPDTPRGLRPALRYSMQQWIEQRCGERVPLRQPLVPVARREATSVEEFFRNHPTPRRRQEAMGRLWREIDSTLDSGRPISIGFNANDLHADSNINARDADHSSVIAARRERNGQCEYFVRNHYGHQCGYRAGIQCDSRLGGAWIRREHLRTLYGTVSIAPP